MGWHKTTTADGTGIWLLEMPPPQEGIRNSEFDEDPTQILSLARYLKRGEILAWVADRVAFH